MKAGKGSAAKAGDSKAQAKPEKVRPLKARKTGLRIASVLRRPAASLIAVAPSVKGGERPYKLILEKEAVYEKPLYLA